MKFLSKKIISLLTPFFKRSNKEISIIGYFLRFHTLSPTVFILVFLTVLTSCTTVREKAIAEKTFSEEKQTTESETESQAFEGEKTEASAKTRIVQPQVFEEALVPKENPRIKSYNPQVPLAPVPKSSDTTPPKPLVPTKTTLSSITLPIPRIALASPQKMREDDGGQKEPSQGETQGPETKLEGPVAEKGRAPAEDKKLDQSPGTEDRKEKEPGKEDEASITPEEQTKSMGYDELLTLEEQTLATIPLEGEGWIFLSSSIKDSGLEFRGRENQRGKTFFSFFTGAPTVTDLSFQLQDLEKGILERRILRLRILSKYDVTQEDTKKEGEKGGFPPPKPDSEKKEEDTAEERYRNAKKLYQQEEYKKALVGFLSAYHIKNDPETAEKIAELYRILKNYDAALTWMEKNLEAPTLLRERALKGIIEVAILKERIPLLEKYFSEFLKIQEIDITGTVESLAHFYLMRKDYPKGIHILEEYIKLPRKKAGLDSLYYLLASMYEHPGDGRNIKKAKDYYTIVYDEYPLSPYWNAAREKINYIERFYLKIR